ncbi:MAG TPA: hypothetical protein VJU77_11275 [Chthoniobacterales bacterium]|nr:hypothetical protein [Chthoniobacterales bacterium]
MNTLQSFLGAAFVVLFSSNIQAKSPASYGFISGVYQKGHNVTEPRAKSSKFVQLTDAGFFVSGSQASYYVSIQMSAETPAPYFMQAIFENPNDPKKPFVEQKVISPGEPARSIFHGPVKGLRISRSYHLTIKLFRKKDEPTPFDVLEQTVRSYIDTTGPEIKIKKGMAYQPLQ